MGQTDHMEIKIRKGHEICTQKVFHPKASKIYQKFHFWYENIPSGIPDPQADLVQ
jgi:hypothetical protein